MPEIFTVPTLDPANIKLPLLQVFVQGRRQFRSLVRFASIYRTITPLHSSAADEIGRESRVAEVFDGKGGAYRARGHDEGQQGDFDDGDHRREDERCARHGADRGQHDGAGQQLAFCCFFSVVGAGGRGKRRRFDGIYLRRAKTLGSDITFFRTVVFPGAIGFGIALILARPEKFVHPILLRFIFPDYDYTICRGIIMDPKFGGAARRPAKVDFRIVFARERVYNESGGLRTNKGCARHFERTRRLL